MVGFTAKIYRDVGVGTFKVAISESSGLIHGSLTVVYKLSVDCQL